MEVGAVVVAVAGTVIVVGGGKSVSRAFAAKEAAFEHMLYKALREPSTARMDSSSCPCTFTTRHFGATLDSFSSDS
jgi:hypothetical protein